MNHRKYGNALVFYGGGLCDCANFYIARLTDQISKTGLFDKTFVGFFSFRCLTLKGLIEEWTTVLRDRAINSSGGFFGTCRKTNLAEDDFLRKRALSFCKEKNIKWIFLAGGDGSSRQMSEIANTFKEEGINFVFTMPMTIDGMEGGKSYGLRSAVNATVNQIEYISSSTLRTLDGNKWPGIVYELQGRNRDDILANVLLELTKKDKIAEFEVEDLRIIAIPANISWNLSNLKKHLMLADDEESETIIGKPTIILLSEGATITKEKIVALAKKGGMKLRSSRIGHYSQINGYTNSNEKHDIRKDIDITIEAIKKEIPKEKPFSVIISEDGKLKIGTENYFAKINPREDTEVTWDIDLQELIQNYLP